MLELLRLDTELRLDADDVLELLTLEAELSDERLLVELELTELSDERLLVELEETELRLDSELVELELSELAELSDDALDWLL